MYKKIVLVVLCCLFLCGCWDYNELTSHAHPFIIGFDVNNDAEKYGNAKWVITNIVAHPSEAESTGHDVQVFLLNEDPISHMAPWRVTVLPWDYGSTKGLILGDSVAAGGIAPIINEFLRDAAMRLTTYMAVAETHANDVLTQSSRFESSSKISAILDLVMNSTPYSMVTQCSLYQFAHDYLNEGYTPALPVIAITKENRLEIVGTALFRGDVMVKKLGREASTWMNMLRESKTNGFLMFKTDDSSGGVEFECQRRVKTQIENGIPIVTYKLAVSCTMRSINGMQDILRMNDTSKAAEIEAAIERQLRAVLDEFFYTMQHVDKVDSINSLAFVLGKDRKTFSGRLDEIFPQIQYKTEIDVKLSNFGELR